MAYRHECVNAHNPSAGYRHSHGSGKPTRKRCVGCGGALQVSTGQYGVFVWRGDRHYPAANAVALFERESAAEKLATSNSDYVVRFVIEP